MREENKRIAKNTIVVYLRLIITTLLGLISSRIVLNALGASDYGLYNVVGAIVVMFSFITSALYSTTTRFINFEQGKPNGDVNRVFNISLTLHVVFAVVAFLLLESIGVYYINHYLNVAVGKEADAMFVFQVSTIITCLSLVGVPYNSLFIVHEDFSTIAVIDILGAVIKFILILLLLCYPGNLLRFYAVCMSLITLASCITYYLLSKRRWPLITKINIVKKKNEYRDILVFNNYTLMSAVSLIIRNQGSNMVINYFFGTIVNAAYAVSFSVQNYIITFVGNFDTASAPQITQNISRGDLDRTVFLASSTCRVCMLLTLLLLFPIYSELGFILHLWLGDALPSGSIVFCECTLLVALASATSGGVTQLINGTGRLKWFTIQFTVLYVLSLVLSIILYNFNFPPYSIILIYFLADCISRFNQLYLLHRFIGLNLRKFAQNSYMRPLGVFLCGVLYVIITKSIIIESVTAHIINFLISFIFMAGSILCIGLKQEERRIFVSYVERLKK